LAVAVVSTVSQAVSLFLCQNWGKWERGVKVAGGRWESGGKRMSSDRKLFGQQFIRARQIVLQIANL